MTGTTCKIPPRMLAAISIVPCFNASPPRARTPPSQSTFATGHRHADNDDDDDDDDVFLSAEASVIALRSPTSFIPPPPSTSSQKPASIHIPRHQPRQAVVGAHELLERAVAVAQLDSVPLEQRPQALELAPC
jgi:hypothetical protein